MLCRSGRGLPSGPTRYWRGKIEPGVDFALTEVVHCKSLMGSGVLEAREFCSKRYLERVLSVSAAKVLVVCGEKARAVVVSRFGPTPDLSILSIGGRPRIVTFLAAPAAFGGKKTLVGKYGDAGLSLIRTHLRS